MEIELSDFPEHIYPMIEVIGIENFVKVMKVCGGDSIYIPTYGSVFRKVRNREILSRYNGENIRELAKEYDMSINQVRRIVE